MFGFLKQHLSKAYNAFSQIRSLFTQPHLDAATLQELERQLLMADTGTSVVRAVVAQAKKEATTPAQLQEVVRRELGALLIPYVQPNTRVYLLIGVNGSGKTTVAGKLAHLLGAKTLLVGADTFRAAAGQQLQTWATRTQTDAFIGAAGQDPAAVVHQAAEQFKAGEYSHLIIDTAGRLQTKTHLMKELEKIRRILGKQLPGETIHTLLTIDAMLGQNSLEQAKLFHEVAPIDGIVLTKMDGSSKGGAVFAISHDVKVPIAYISYGEGLEALAPFKAQEFLDELLND